MFQYLSWIVGIIILGLAAGALFVLWGAWNKLRSEKLAVEDSEKVSLPKSVAEARNLLSRPNVAGTNVARALEVTIESGSVGTEQLNWHEWIYWSRYCAGIFVFVGLAGTVGGIAFAVANLGQTVMVTSNLSASTATATSTSSFSMDSWNHLLHGINDLLGGMTSASLSTLFGLAATVVVSLLNSFYFTACHKTEEAVELLANKMFYPVWQQAKKSQDVSSLVGAATTLSLAADSLTASSDRFQVEIVAAANELQNKILSAAKDLPAVYRDAQFSFEQIIQEANSLFGQMQQLTQSLKTDAASVSQGYTKLEKSLGKAGVILQNDCQLLMQSAEALSNSSAQLTREREGLAYTANVVSNSASIMQQAVSQLQSELTSTQKIRDERMENLLHSVDKTHQSMHAILNKMDNTLSRLPALADMTAVSREIAGIKSEMSAQLKAATKQIATAIEALPVRYDTKIDVSGSQRYNSLPRRDNVISPDRSGTYTNTNASPVNREKSPLFSSVNDVDPIDAIVAVTPFNTANPVPHSSQDLQHQMRQEGNQIQNNGLDLSSVDMLQQSSKIQPNINQEEAKPTSTLSSFVSKLFRRQK